MSPIITLLGTCLHVVLFKILSLISSVSLKTPHSNHEGHELSASIYRGENRHSEHLCLTEGVGSGNEIISGSFLCIYQDLSPHSYVARGDKHSLGHRSAKGAQIWEVGSAGRSISDSIICVIPDKMLSKAQFSLCKKGKKYLCLFVKAKRDDAKESAF